MKTLIASIVILFALNANAALHFAGFWQCNTQQNKCSTAAKRTAYAQQMVQKAYSCWSAPNGTAGASCNLTQGDRYIAHVTVTHWQNGAIINSHLEWVGEAFFVPQNPGHYVIWRNVTFNVIGETSLCSQHAGPQQ